MPDRVAREVLHEPGPAHLQHPERALEQDHEEHERHLPQLDAHVEEEQSERDLRLRQAHRGEAAREAEAVQQPEREGHHPRVADGEARLAPPGPHDLGAEEQDRESDRGVERRQRRARVAERRDRQRDAVGQGEGRDRLHQRPAVGDDQHQAEDEEQVVDAEQDVLHAELHVAEGPLGGGGDAAERHRGRRGAQQVALQAAVGVVQAHEDVGDRGLEPRDRDRLPGQAARAGEGAAHDEGARRELLPVGGREPAVLRDDRRDLDLDLAAGRLLPEERVGLLSRLAQLEEAGTGLVSEAGGRAREHEAREEQEDEPRLHRAPPTPAAAAGGGVAFGFSIVTVYFSSSRS